MILNRCYVITLTIASILFSGLSCWADSTRSALLADLNGSGLPATIYETLRGQKLSDVEIAEMLGQVYREDVELLGKLSESEDRYAIAELKRRVGRTYTTFGVLLIRLSKSISRRVTLAQASSAQAEVERIEKQSQSYGRILGGLVVGGASITFVTSLIDATHALPVISALFFGVYAAAYGVVFSPAKDMTEARSRLHASKQATAEVSQSLNRQIEATIAFMGLNRADYPKNLATDEVVARLNRFLGVVSSRECVLRLGG